LHWLAPPISRYGHLQYGALRRRLEQEPSTSSAIRQTCGKQYSLFLRILLIFDDDFPHRQD